MSGKTILAFEPDPVYGKMLQDELEAHGFSVEIVSDGIQGLEYASANKPDLIYLSIELPRISGFSVCNKLRKNDSTKKIPLIITSAEANQETFEKHKRLKVAADIYILKPFAASDIINKTKELIGESDLLDEDVALDDDGIVFDDDDDMEFDDLNEIEEIEEIEESEELIDVDDDVDAFTESAFDAISMDVKEEQPKPEEQQFNDLNVSTPVVSSENIASAKLDKLKDDNATLRDKIAKLEKKALDSQVPKSSGAGVSSREFLDLRELLNKKDRELLDLKDSVNSKEKQLLEIRERTTGLERSRADLEDVNIEAEKRNNDLVEKVGNLTSDKEIQIKKATDLQHRVESLQGKVEGLQGDIDKEKHDRAADVERLGFEKESEISRVKGDKEAEKEDAIFKLQKQLESDKNRALEEQSTELLGEAEKSREISLTEQRIRHGSKIEDLNDQFANEKQKALAEKEAEFDEKIKNITETNLEEIGKYKSKLYDNEEKTNEIDKSLKETTASLLEAREELTAMHKTLDTKTDELQVTFEKLKNTEVSLETTSGKLSEAKKTLDNAISKCEDVKTELKSTKEKNSALEVELDEINDILGRNEETVEKAKKALDVATNLLEQIGTDDDDV